MNKEGGALKHLLGRINSVYLHTCYEHTCIQYLLLRCSARSYCKYCVYYQSLTRRRRVGTGILIFQKRKLSFREAKYVAQEHTAEVQVQLWDSQASAPNSLQSIKGGQMM